LSFPRQYSNKKRCRKRGNGGKQQSKKSHLTAVVAVLCWSKWDKVEVYLVLSIVVCQLLLSFPLFTAYGDQACVLLENNKLKVIDFEKKHSAFKDGWRYTDIEEQKKKKKTQGKKKEEEQEGEAEEGEEDEDTGERTQKRKGGQEKKKEQEEDTEEDDTEEKRSERAADRKRKGGQKRKKEEEEDPQEDNSEEKRRESTRKRKAKGAGKNQEKEPKEGKKGGQEKKPKKVKRVTTHSERTTKQNHHLQALSNLGNPRRDTLVLAPPSKKKT